MLLCGKYLEPICAFLLRCFWVFFWGGSSPHAFLSLLKDFSFFPAGTLSHSRIIKLEEMWSHWCNRNSFARNRNITCQESGLGSQCHRLKFGWTLPWIGTWSSFPPSLPPYRSFSQWVMSIISNFAALMQLQCSPKVRQQTFPWCLPRTPLQEAAHTRCHGCISPGKFNRIGS